MPAWPTLTALRCFDASARHQSFTRAAREVHLTQGAVSHQILGLEQLLGVPLFERRRSGLALTAAGQAYWGEVSAALRQIERATQDLATHQGRGGSLNLCCASSFATYWLVPRLPGFVAAHPEVTLNLSTHIGPVDFGRAPHDAAIEFCTGPTPELDAVLVQPLALRPYAAPAVLRRQGARRTRAGLSRADLARVLTHEPLIRHTTVPEGWDGWLAAARLQDEVQAARGPQYDLLSMALNGAIAGLGVALLPAYVVGAALRSGQLVALSPIEWSSQKGYWLRCPHAKAGLAALRSFRGWLARANLPA